MFFFFTKNKRRKRGTSRGNFQFRRKPSRAALLHRLELNRLDLNPETDASRRERLIKRAGTGARWAFGLIAVILFAALLNVVVKEAFVENPRFRLQDVDVTTVGPLSKSAIITASGLKIGDHMLMISLREVRDRIEALPDVDGDRVTVERDFPGRILISAPQRTPVAWLECPAKAISANVSGYGCMLDADGVILPSNSHNATGGEKLPIIRVEKLPVLKPGQKIESAAALNAIALLQLQRERASKGKLLIHTVDATQEHKLVAKFTNDITATFPADGNFPHELLRLQATLEEAVRLNWKIATVNLLVEHNVPVTLRGSSETAATTPARRNLPAAR